MGQSVGLVHDVPTVKELVDRIVEEALAARERLDKIIG
jgi:NAD(P)H-dependent flavin oxidoreductase YrpB (nitropropane dioxygenase family)